MRPQIDPAALAELRRLWSMRGSRPWTLALRFGLSPAEVRELCDWRRMAAEAKAGRRRREKARRRREEAARRRAARKAARDAEIRRLWSEGEPGPNLCEWFGLAKSTISGIVAGMPKRRRYGDPENVAWPHPRRRPPDRAAPSPRVPVAPGPADALPEFRPGRRGSSNGRAKLDEAAVVRLRRLRAEGWTYPALAREFGISRSNVFYILSGKTWGPAPAIGGGE